MWKLPTGSLLPGGADVFTMVLAEETRSLFGMYMSWSQHPASLTQGEE